ncbi:hypothetical protein [Akkermansia glycaniphila]|uniref:Anti-bacteriophage protein A/HamA C-terminal domain-containing protein n=1 Tax=Akkermansia glycaniphila TaxID=1679444 RepID=A0A1H6MQ96_9BACT|nr:hypothetical protein [Akkermansia glycaniphila]SEH99885.1 Hypothetical protein PYTT_2440 [Akkermansia glycaniphila]
MKIVGHQINKHLINLFDYKNVHFICVEINNIPNYAKELIESIKNTSWIDKLDVIGKLSYTETSFETIDKLVAIFSVSEDPISTDFGEYLISMTAGSSLEKLLSHEVLPLSELWKEKKSGNAGFDFHTITPRKLISFGEAKYSSVRNPYKAAIEQIVSFINHEKGNRDLPHLQIIAGKESIDNFLKGDKCYCAAFSLQNTQTFDGIIKKITSLTEFGDIIHAGNEIFVIGIKICHP